LVGLRVTALAQISSNKGKKGRKKERKKERKVERKKEIKKERKKGRKRERKKERNKEGKEERMKDRSRVINHDSNMKPDQRLMVNFSNVLANELAYMAQICWSDFV
jgi:hypothetical protein